jgi:hypothetical protein
LLTTLTLAALTTLLTTLTRLICLVLLSALLANALGGHLRFPLSAFLLKITTNKITATASARS